MAAKNKAGKAKAKCLICKKRTAYSRGDCQPCLRDAYEMIRQRKTTEDKLMAAGLMLPRLKCGRKVAPSALLERLNGKST